MIFNDVYLSNRDLDNLSPIHSPKEKGTNPCTGMYYKEIDFGSGAMISLLYLFLNNLINRTSRDIP